MNLTAPLFADAPDRSVEGTWESGFFEPVRPAPGEIVVYKRSVSALAGTELDRLLRLRDINTLVLTGVATHFAVEGTAREAVDRGYRVICCASREREVHDFSIAAILRRLCPVTMAESFIRTLDGGTHRARGRRTRTAPPPRTGRRTRCRAARHGIASTTQSRRS
jgi:nicotinamidase-related amidase